MVQEHRKRKTKTLTQHKPEEAGSKIILIYSDQPIVEVRSSKKSGNCKIIGGREESAAPAYGKNNSFRLYAL